MAHITLPEGLPGIRGPMAFRPETAKPLNEFAEVLLRSENSLTRGERELIATYVSSLNDCFFVRMRMAGLRNITCSAICPSSIR
jgi:alkylhydroperoxidase family enzyme